MAQNRKLALSNAGIDTAADETEQFLSDANVDAKDILRIRLAMEEALLNYRG